MEVDQATHTIWTLEAEEYLLPMGDQEYRAAAVNIWLEKQKVTTFQRGQTLGL